MNDKFLSGKGEFSIDFSQISRIEWNTNDVDKFLILMFTKGRYPIFVLSYDSMKKMLYVYKQLQAVIDKKEKAKIVNIDDYRKD